MQFFQIPLLVAFAMILLMSWQMEASQSPQNILLERMMKKASQKSGLSAMEMTQYPQPLKVGDPDDPWRGHNTSDIPKFDSDDTIEILLIFTPLMKWTLGDILKVFNMYHGAMAFRSRKTGKSWQTEFDGLPTMISSTLPDIVVNNSTGEKTLEWKSYGGALIFMPLFDDYWENKTMIGTLTGDQHNAFVQEYMNAVNSTHPHYNLWNIIDHNTGETYMDSYDCWDFVFDTMDALYKYGAKFDYSQKVFTVKGEWHVKSKPTPVDFNDPQHHNPIIEFFEFALLKFKEMKPIEIIMELSDILLGRHVYIYNPDQKQYYLLEVTKPYYKYQSIQRPLPGQREFMKSQEPSMGPITKH